jgi:hypothetical protein
MTGRATKRYITRLTSSIGALIIVNLAIITDISITVISHVIKIKRLTGSWHIFGA